MHNGLIAVLVLASIAPQVRTPETKPNILFVMVDDLGKEWVSCYGGDDIETPNVDQLAAGGTQFESAWCMPQCTTTRITLLTGQYPFRHGWVNHWDVPRWGGGCSFDPKLNPSIGLVMKSAGYVTAAAGKWQIDDFRQEPNAMVDAGFDEYFMWTGYEAENPSSDNRYTDPYIHSKEGSQKYEGEFGPDLYTDFLIDFMREHKDRPMFLYFPMCLPHAPLVPTPLEPRVQSKLGRHKAMVRHADHLLGRLVRELDDLGIRENTIIIWTSDNGTLGFKGKRNGRVVPGGKAKTAENGICVPFIVNCPGTVPSGVTTDALVDFTDLLPTFADLGGAELPTQHTFDGRSFKDLILGKADDSQREWLLSMGGRNGARLTVDGVQNQYWFRDRVLRDRRYKLFVDSDRQPVRLIDLDVKRVQRRVNLIDTEDAEPLAALNKLMAVVDSLPDHDNDPLYTPLPTQPWFVEPQPGSQTWKIGYPQELPEGE